MFQQKDYEDKLREITSIGSGHLATRLSKMINWKVEISLPAVWAEKSKKVEDILPFKRRIKLIFRKAIVIRNEFTVEKGSASQAMVPGKTKGIVIQIMEIKTAKNLLRFLFNREIKEFDEIDKIVLKKTFTDLAIDMVRAVGELIEGAISIEPAKMVETPLLSGIKETLKEQREALGWTYFSTVNIYIRGKEGISFLVLLLPLFDIASLLPAP